MAQPEMTRRLKRIERLSMLDDAVLADLARVVVERRLPSHTVICQQGQVEDEFYAIELGEVVVQAEMDDRQIEVGRFYEGDVFGEQALTGDRPRTATIVADSTVDLLVLNRQDYRPLAQKHRTLKRILEGPDIPPLLKNVPLFSGLYKEELEDLATRMGTIFYPPARRVVEQGDIGTTMFVVSEGELVAYRVDERGRSRPVKALQKGDAFGETSLLVGEPRDATVITKTYTELCYLNQPSFHKFLQEHPNAEDRLRARPEVERKREAGSFPGQQPNEIVEVMEGKHWISFADAISGPALVLFLFATILGVAQFVWLRPAGILDGGGAISTLLTMLWAGLLLMASGIFTWHWVDWRNDYHIVTTQRVIHVENELFRATERAEVPIQQVQNVHVEQNLWGEIFDFGHLRVTTAGAAKGLLSLEYVYHPEEFQHIIFEQISRNRYPAIAAEREELQWAIKQAIGISALEDKIEEPGSPSGPKSRPGWLVLLAKNPITRRLHQTLTGSGLAAFLRRPHLPRMQIVEKDRVIWRKHWGVLFRTTYRPLFLSSFVLLLLLGSIGWRLGWYLVGVYSEPVFKAILLGLAVVFVPVFSWLAWAVEDWRNDLYIVTDTHIIDIERTPFLLRESRRQASLDKIQNTNASTEGFWAGVFQLGDVNIETAGEGTFTFTEVRNPNKVQAEIDRRREAYEARLREEEAVRRRASMAKWFDAYHGVAREIDAMTKRAQQQLPDWTESSEVDEG
jgi:CRP-like cAMP-binding protein/membrane protein YdbS with pleckstrin-like domain